tara:strand:- start:1463 stop:1807 length:345 start_codon:yes stop_codon:yes gene_type:complete
MDLENEIEVLEGRIVEIKNEIMELGEIRNGSVSEQYNVCGNPTCRCKDKDNPQKHGPYYQLSYSFNKKSTSQFVSAENIDKVRQQLAGYKMFMKLKDEWVGASIELSKLRKKLK